MERVSGNVVEFEMSSLTPATHYTVKVYAVRDLAKSAATTTEFTTGENGFLYIYLFPSWQLNCWFIEPNLI